MHHLRVLPTAAPPSPDARYVRPLQSLSLRDLALVGGKAASIGELHRTCAGSSVRVPPGFAVTAEAYRETLAQAGIRHALEQVLEVVDTDDPLAVAAAGARARALVRQAPMPRPVETALREAWRALLSSEGGPVAVAVRSSATAEDLPGASFAGQHDSLLDIRDEDTLLDAVRHCQASLYNDRAIVYRAARGYAHADVALAVVVMKMVRSDLAASGVIFTLDTESGHPDVVLVQATWGLGEGLVQGTVDPDEYLVHKPTFEAGARCVLQHRLGGKQTRVVSARTGDGGHRQGELRNETVPKAEQVRACLSDELVLGLAETALAIERHYSDLAGRWTPMDIEWAQDGPEGPVYVVQARPETVISRRPARELVRHRLSIPTDPANALLSGRAVGEGIASGKVRVVDSPLALQTFQPGEVLVAPMTTPDWEPVMKRASAIITERGGRTCHAAIVARELGIPAVVGATAALSILRPGQEVTVSCCEGEIAHVYGGVLPHHTERMGLDTLPRLRTRLMVNLGNPALAWKTALLPCDGVGLARMEFVISEHVGAHPMALLHPERIVDACQRQRVLSLWQDTRCPGGAAYFVEKLSEGVGAIAAAFWPRPVIARLSDFKSSEYAGLPGGADFEPCEPNPMLGLRGAARYLHPSYAEAFALECAALARVRGEMGLVNLAVMVPFCRRVTEARAVLAAMARHGLARGSGPSLRAGAPGLKVLLMCEIPNNVMLVDEFAQCFDGFSIGSNDLTQLALGVDRDSALVADSFDEGDLGVVRLYKMAIEGAHRHGRGIGICGQAPSDRPDIVRTLVSLGIDSISVSPDRWLATSSLVAEAESVPA